MTANVHPPSLPSLHSADFPWSASRLLPGASRETETSKDLLDAGFAVLTPESHLSGFTSWDTNVPGLDNDDTPDKRFVEDILDELAAGTFGPIDTGRLFATAMSPRDTCRGCSRGSSPRWWCPGTGTTSCRPSTIRSASAST